MIPVKASGWFNTPLSDDERADLLASGVLPVNDKYVKLYDSKGTNVMLVYGGRGGGKSEAVADYLIDQCLTEPYAKIYYGRKVFENVRGSCFETIIYCIKKRKLEGSFHFSEASTSTMEIRSRTSGSKFVPFGSDKADKLKSIKDPTHFWLEEADQFNFDDFRELYPTLRSKRGRNQLVATFNTHPVYPDHWLIKCFFPAQYTGEDKTNYDMLEGVKVGKIFANYSDNYYIDQAEYYQQLRLASGGNETILQGIAHGAWGVMENNNPWLYAFDDSKHTRDNVPFLPTYPVYLSFDFNNDPFACTAWQMSPDMGNKSSFIHGIKEFSGYMKVEEMCQRIRATYPASILYVTGDRSGQNEDIGRNQTLYQMIASLLGLNKKQLDLNNSNLEHADSRIFINAMLSAYPNIFISRSGCPGLIRQCNMAAVDGDSHKPSHLKKDRGNYKMDEFDSMRYFFQTYFHDFAKRTYFRAIRK